MYLYIWNAFPLDLHKVYVYVFTFPRFGYNINKSKVILPLIYAVSRVQTINIHYIPLGNVNTIRAIARRACIINWSALYKAKVPISDVHVKRPDEHIRWVCFANENAIGYQVRSRNVKRNSKEKMGWASKNNKTKKNSMRTFRPRPKATDERAVF